MKRKVISSKEKVRIKSSDSEPIKMFFPRKLRRNPSRTRVEARNVFKRDINGVFLNKFVNAKFVPLKLIGQGSFGNVLLAKRSRNSDDIVAVKILNKLDMLKRNQKTRIETELFCLELCSGKSKFFPKYYGSYQTKLYLYIVQEFIQGGELYHHLGTYTCLSDDTCKSIISECVMALEFLQRNLIIYRDFKPENIMFDNRGHVKLVDFGLSKKLTFGSFHPERGCLSFVGTQEYLSPEILLKNGHGFAVDFWALGMVLFEMLFGLPPWYNENHDILSKDIVNKPVEFCKSIKPVTKDFILNLLEKNPLKRLGSDSFEDIKEHEYFACEVPYGFNWEDVREQRLKSRLKLDLVHELDTSYFDNQFTKTRIDFKGTYAEENEQKTFDKLCLRDRRTIEYSEKSDYFNVFKEEHIFF